MDTQTQAQKNRSGGLLCTTEEPQQDRSLACLLYTAEQGGGLLYAAKQGGGVIQIDTLSAFTLSLSSLTQGRLFHCHGSEALESWIWLCPVEQYTFTQDVTHSQKARVGMASDFTTLLMQVDCIVLAVVQQIDAF